jgi:hypothetical protein
VRCGGRRDAAHLLPRRDTDRPGSAHPHPGRRPPARRRRRGPAGEQGARARVVARRARPVADAGDARARHPRRVRPPGRFGTADGPRLAARLAPVPVAATGGERGLQPALAVGPLRHPLPPGGVGERLDERRRCTVHPARDRASSRAAW